jgi:hypothetical protein
MAVITTGLLATKIAGRIGGVAFSAKPSGQVVGVARGRARRGSNRQTETRVIFARAATAWRGLTAEDRRIWDQFAATLSKNRRLGARGAPDGFHAFVARFNVIAATEGWNPAGPPVGMGSSAALQLVIEQFQYDTVITGAERDLIEQEFAVFVVYSGQSASVAHGNRRMIHKQWTEFRNAFGVDNAWGMLTLGGSSGMIQSTALTIGDLTSYEVWFFAIAIPVGNWCLLEDPDYGVRVRAVGGTGELELVAGATTASGVNVTAGVWYQLLMQMDSATGDTVVWLDGVVIMDVAGAGVGASVGRFSISRRYATAAESRSGVFTRPGQFNLGLPATNPAALWQGGRGINSAALSGVVINAYLLRGDGSFTDPGVTGDGDLVVDGCIPAGSAWSIPIANLGDMYPAGGVREFRCSQANLLQAGVTVQFGKAGLI